MIHSAERDMKNYYFLIVARILPMNISISLTPELVGLIKAKVDSGRYTSTSEVVREALRLLERLDEREAEASARMRKAWDEGIASGDAGPLDFAALRQEARSKLAERAKK